MFAYILRTSAPVDAQQEEQSEDFFRRFKEVPGLLHAYELAGTNGSDEALVVAVWEDQAAAERYLESAPLRREVDEALPSVTRRMYEVRDAK